MTISSTTISFSVYDDTRALLHAIAVQRGFRTINALCREIIHNHVGQITPPISPEVPRLKAMEITILSFLKHGPATITEMCRLGQYARPNVQPHITSMLDKYWIAEGSLRRTNARPARTYTITEAGRAMLERENERVALLHKAQDLETARVRASIRNKNKGKFEPPEHLKGTSEGHYLIALFHYGEGSLDDKDDEYTFTKGKLEVMTDNIEERAQLWEDEKEYIIKQYYERLKTAEKKEAPTGPTGGAV